MQTNDLDFVTDDSFHNAFLFDYLYRTVPSAGISYCDSSMLMLGADASVPVVDTLTSDKRMSIENLQKTRSDQDVTHAGQNEPCVIKKKQLTWYDCQMCFRKFRFKSALKVCTSMRTQKMLMVHIIMIDIVLLTLICLLS